MNAAFTLAFQRSFKRLALKVPMSNFDRAVAPDRG
jgi:hypothetical protein